MESQDRNLPDYIRNYIVGQVECGFLYDTIVENVRIQFSRIISKGTISKIYAKFLATDSVHDLPRPGAPHLYTSRQEEKIIEAVKNDRKLTGADIARDPKLNKKNATERTIQNILNQDGLIARTSQPKFIGEDSIEQRMRIATILVEKPDIWPCIIFSDESDLFPYKSGKLFIRRYLGEKPLQYYNMHSKWDPRTIKVWGCISVNGVGPLVRYFETMENTKYKSILDTYLLQSFPKLRGSSTRKSALVFQQDNSKVHRANNVKNWFEEKHIQVLEWPSYSPDLNPIENLWGILQDLLYDKCSVLKTSDDVWKETQKIWYNDLNAYLPNLYKGMPMRIEEVLARKGNRLDK